MEMLPQFFHYVLAGLLLSLASVNCLIGVTGNTGFDTGNDICRRTAIRREDNATTCYELNHNSCFGTKLPYSWSTSELVHPNWTQQQLQNDLSRWEGLRNSPKCWVVIRPLLCAVYMPKCHEGVIELPSQELCKVTRSPCRLVEQVIKEWPEFLKCDDPVRYPPNCKNTEIRELRFNTNGSCMDPMILVDDPFSYYEGFEGCGLKCQDPMYTGEQHKDVSQLVWYLSIVVLASTGSVIITYLLDWKSAKGFPSVIIFYVVVCYFIANLGWMLQFLPNAKQDIVCRKDGTVRRGEHRPGENVFCMLVFSLIYFGSLAAMGWLAVFAYVWNLTCNAVGRIRKRVDNQAAYYHALVWSIPSLFTILNFTLGEVDGNSMSGVCFIGHMNSYFRIGFVLCPVVFALLTMLLYFSKGLCRLANVLISAPTLIPESGRRHLRSTVFRVSLFAATAMAIILAYAATEIYLIQMKPIWNQSLHESLICQMNLGDVADCGATQKPAVGILMMNIFLFFAGGVLVSSWAWTASSARTWKRVLVRLFRCGGKSSKERRATYHQPIQKHQLIAQAYEKRYEISQNGRLSLSLMSMHGDPLGLNRMLDPNQLCQGSNSQMNQMNGEDVSSEWVAALPHLILRRNALIVPNSSNNSFSEDNSRPASEMGIRHFRTSNSDLDKPKKRSGLSKLKEKLGSRNRMNRKGRRGSISSFESSELGIRQYQSSNSELERHDCKSKSGLTKIKDKLSRRNGIGWKVRRGSMSSLESNGLPMAIPDITSAAVDRRFGGAKKDEGYKRTPIVREFCMQTSFENLPLLKVHDAIVARNPDMTDKSIQTSIECLQRSDFGTQTKKSATKKHKKKRETGTDAREVADDIEFERGQHKDHVMELLTPG